MFTCQHADWTQKNNFNKSLLCSNFYLYIETAAGRHAHKRNDPSHGSRHIRLTAVGRQAPPPAPHEHEAWEGVLTIRDNTRALSIVIGIGSDIEPVSLSVHGQLVKPPAQNSSIKLRFANIHKKVVAQWWASSFLS